MYVVPAHLIKTILHDKRQRVSVCAMDHLVVLEGVSDPSEQVIGLYSGNRVALDCTYKPYSLLLFELKALFVVGLYDFLHIFQSYSEFPQASVLKYVFYKHIAI